MQITASSLCGCRPCPSQLPVSLLSMFLCPLRRIRQRLALSTISPLLSQTEEKRSGCKTLPLQGFPVFPFPYNPQHTRLNVCLLISHPPQLILYLISSLPPLLCSLLMAEVCCRAENKAVVIYRKAVLTPGCLACLAK